MLNKFIAVYVPGTRDIDKKLTAKEKRVYIDKTAGQLSKLFGGATATKGIGYYVSNDGRLIQESITIVKSFTDDIAAFDKALPIAKELKKELTQESITIETVEGIQFI